MQNIIVLLVNVNGVEMAEEYECPIYVMLSCIHEKIPENETEFINIEEGQLGEDILYFKCPRCGEEHSSRRFG